MPAYYRPRSLDEALAIRAERPVTLLAGGTDVYPAKTARAGWGEMSHADVLDISGVEGLRGIAETPTRLRFGALTTWSELRRAALPPACAGWQAAARDVGGAQIQNRGTLVGNICTASPAGDGIPCLLTLEAEVELASAGGSRTVPIGGFVTGYRRTDIKRDEIVTAIVVPKLAPSARGEFLKLGSRRYLVISIVMVAGVLVADDDGTIGQARIAVGACSPVAQRMHALEAALVGRNLEEAPDLVVADQFAPLSPVDDIRASAAYRRSAAVELTRDLLAGFAAASQLRAA